MLSEVFMIKENGNMKRMKETIMLVAIMATGITIFSSMMYVLIILAYALGTW